MDRTMVYPGELPRVEDFMGFEKQAYYGMGGMIRSAIGPNAGISNGDFQISATGPASMSVIIGTGSIYQSQTVDSAAFGVLGTDSNTIMKQGILTTPVTLNITAPSTSGFSQYYLVQVGFNEVDGNAVVPPFLNSANPNVPWNGANNTGASLNTTRLDQAVVSLVAGTAAATGSQTIPSPSAGSQPLWVILVSNSSTTVTSANWFASPQAPYFPYLEQITSMFQQVIPASTTFWVDSAIGSNTNGNGLTATTAWHDIAHAVAVLATYNLNGNTVTIQLGTIGGYTGPATFAAPSNGTLIVRGDPANKANYTVQLAAATSNSVMGVSSGTVIFNGMTIVNAVGAGSSNVIQCISGANLTIQNIALQTVTNAVGNLIGAGTGGQVTVLSGCSMAGSAAICWSANEATIIQGANVAISGALAFSSTLVSAAFGGIIAQSTTGWSWTGATPTCSRFSATLNGIINSGTGAPNTFWPGTSVGSIATQGQST